MGWLLSLEFWMEDELFIGGGCSVQFVVFG